MEGLNLAQGFKDYSGNVEPALNILHVFVFVVNVLYQKKMSLKKENLFSKTSKKNLVAVFLFLLIFYYVTWHQTNNMMTRVIIRS